MKTLIRGVLILGEVVKVKPPVVILVGVQVRRTTDGKFAVI
jgi:hypothetical protein